MKNFKELFLYRDPGKIEHYNQMELYEIPKNILSNLSFSPDFASKLDATDKGH